MYLILGLGVIIFGGYYDNGSMDYRRSSSSDDDSEQDYDYEVTLEDGRSFSHPDKYNYVELRSSSMKWKISVYGNEEDVLFSFFYAREEKKRDRENPIEQMVGAATFKVSDKIATNLRNVDWEKYPGFKEDDLCGGRCWRYPGSCGDTYCDQYLQQRAVLFVISAFRSFCSETLISHISIRYWLLVYHLFVISRK